MAFKQENRNSEMVFYEFKLNNQISILYQLKLLALIAILMSGYIFFANFYLHKEDANILYLHSLTLLRVIGFSASIIYLFLYHFYLRHLKPNYFKLTDWLIKLYTLIFLGLGTASALNSQRFTGNIDTYIIFVLITALIFSLNPLYMFLLFLVNHLVFYFGIGYFQTDPFIVFTHQINATGLVLFAMVMNLALYKMKYNDFVHRKSLKKSEKNFRSLFDINPYPLLIASIEEDRIIDFNLNAVQFFHLQEKGTTLLNLHDLYVNQNDLQHVYSELMTKGHLLNQVVELNVNGEKRWVVSNYEMIDYFLQPSFLIGVTDITQMKQIESELTKYATIDVLTGVLNRRVGLELLKQVINEEKNDSVLCFIDLDGLKEVNDHYGHPEGDSYIVEVCNTIKNELEERDSIFRMGGDEFIIIFRNKDKSTVETIWERIERHFEAFNASGRKPYAYKVSHGLFQMNEKSEATIEEIIGYADFAMYKKKAEYKK